MTEKAYYASVSIVFTIIATGHFVRAIDNWGAVIGDITIPVWVSWIMAGIATYMAVRGLELYREKYGE